MGKGDYNEIHLRIFFSDSFPYKSLNTFLSAWFVSVYLRNTAAQLPVINKSSPAGADGNIYSLKQFFSSADKICSAAVLFIISVITKCSIRSDHLSIHINISVI